MYTLGYSFKPWTQAKAIADGPSILDYVRETASEHGIDEQIRFHHRVVRAEWSTADARWTVEARAQRHRTRRVHLTCGFLLMCSGYYRYDEGYTPDFQGTERFAGQIVHPQQWTEDIDYAGKRVVVIGSGATAVTLVPAMAADGGARHDAAALAELRRVVAGEGPDRRCAASRAPGARGLLDRALEERAAHDVQLPAQPSPAGER